MKNILQISKQFFNHPIGRGMVSYGITFPTACFIQQFYDKRNLGKYFYISDLISFVSQAATS